AGASPAASQPAKSRPSAAAAMIAATTCSSSLAGGVVMVVSSFGCGGRAAAAGLLERLDGDFERDRLLVGVGVAADGFPDLVQRALVVVGADAERLDRAVRGPDGGPPGLGPPRPARKAEPGRARQAGLDHT